MPRKVLIFDTSILCVWLRLPGMTTCGPGGDKWDCARVDAKLHAEEKAQTTFVLPLAAIIETGNHISQSGGDRFKLAQALGAVMRNAADSATPWAAFSAQSELWSDNQVRALADTWPPLAAQQISLGDATISQVAEYYALAGYAVELLTADQGLKAYEPAKPVAIPRRRANKA